MQSNPRILVNVLVILVKILVNLLVKLTKLGKLGELDSNLLYSTFTVLDFTLLDSTLRLLYSINYH